MVAYKPETTREKILVERERKRVWQQDVALKNAVRVASNYKDAYDNIKKELDELKRASASLAKDKKRMEKAIRDSDSIDIAIVLAGLSPQAHVEVKTALRKSTHPDKHMVSQEAKAALGNIFHILEDMLS